MASIIRVFPTLLHGLWPQVEPLIEPILAERDTYDADDVRLMCLGGEAQLWMQWAEPAVEAVMVTTFAVYPTGSWVRVWLDGARKDRKQDHAAFIEELEKWRVVNKCRGFELVGRSGWARLLPKMKIEGVLMRWTEDN